MSITVKPAPAASPAGDQLSSGDLPKLSDRAYAWIRDALVLLEIRPGDPVNEERLAAELGMGRTPIREALKRLESELLVVSFPRRGTYAAEINVLDLSHLFDVRRLLEPLAARQAAVQASAADRAGLGRLLDGIGVAGDTVRSSRELLRADLSIHRALYAAAHNPFLEDTLTRYDNLATRIWGLVITHVADVTGHIDQHAALLEAVIAADPETAAQLALEHVTDFHESVRRVL
ncbi:MAG TPA: GntR family transcriptional regulator [Propionibacteriaceae bacterium]